MSVNASWCSFFLSIVSKVSKNVKSGSYGNEPIDLFSDPRDLHALREHKLSDCSRVGKSKRSVLLFSAAAPSDLLPLPQHGFHTLFFATLLSVQRDNLVLMRMATV